MAIGKSLGIFRMEGCFTDMRCFRDIVDVKHIRGGMRGIMMGPLSRSVDDEPEYFSAREY